MKEKRYYWIKLKTDFFNQEAIDFLMSQENGCEYIVLYQMLCLQTANTGGNMSTEIGEIIAPFDVKKIVRDTKYFDVDTVTVALELFMKLGLIYREQNGALQISNYHEMIGSESASAHRVRKHRALQSNEKALQSNKLPLHSNKNVTQEYRDKSIDIRDKSIDSFSNEKDDIYTQIKKLYNNTCKSLTPIKKISKTRKTLIDARLQDYTIDDFKKVFELAEKSDFLSGRNGKWTNCNFDWLIKSNNFLKVIEGTYKNSNRNKIESHSYDFDKLERQMVGGKKC